MDSVSKQTTTNRLCSVAGHVKSVERMVADDKCCIDVKKNKEVQAALARVSDMLMDGHLDACLTTAIRGEDSGERERVLKENLEVYQFGGK